MKIFFSYTHTPASLDHVRDLRSAIEGVSRLRYTLAHEDAHLLFGPNATGMTSVLGIVSVGYGRYPGRRVAPGGRAPKRCNPGQHGA